MSTFRVSSNATLFLAIFVPVFWLVFFGSLTAAIFLYEGSFFAGLPIRQLRWGAGLFYGSGVLLLLFTLMRLKRVELDRDFVYVTNYFKTYRYPYHNVEKIETSDFLFLGFGVIHLRDKGSFGRRIPFVRSQKLYELFMDEHPDIRARVSP
jgi:hypothetical protein